jgi:hypothetical protein
MIGNPDFVRALTVRHPMTQAVVRIGGREGWALAHLISAGAAGLTTLEQPAPRWSHYVYCLRRRGFAVMTERETHGGAFAGQHGRYRLEVIPEVLALETQDGDAGQ